MALHRNDRHGAERDRAPGRASLTASSAVVSLARKRVARGEIAVGHTLGLPLTALNDCQSLGEVWRGCAALQPKVCDGLDVSAATYADIARSLRLYRQTAAFRPGQRWSLLDQARD